MMIKQTTHNLNEGHILFSTEFKYLGSIINNDLNKEILQQIKKGHQQYGALRKVLQNWQVKLRTKIPIYISVIQNTVLWGCESWTLSHKSKRKLLPCQHKMFRKITRINICEVQVLRITNNQLRRLVNKCKDNITVIKSQQLKWLGTIALMDHKIRMPKKLLTCWNQNPLKPGRPELNNKKIYYWGHIITLFCANQIRNSTFFCAYIHDDCHPYIQFLNYLN